ncbi:protease inhibitor I42 family protein [Photobacterium alginatilyticum]|uniref:Proteinase inhibitor I42 chagasin domain-containing protein n=1 Tax=Photobacterium alginatilyticum TaxID=1775171 RepID=A0ABW9YDT9_9GAMM|nr:protease inhibitor I42 family protein [Photobacterium alginatilyticum]NBI51939.1 hypothetical protein [Photobacterium alginatilyticum]
MTIEKQETLLVSGAINKVALHQLANFIVDTNASTGYTWSVIPDNSGTYELTQIVNLETNIGLIGSPGKNIYQFEAIRQGTGSVLFKHFPPGRSEAVETVEVTIEVA